MVNKDTIFGITPWAPSHAYANKRRGNPARTQQNPVLGCRVVLMMTWWVMDCGKAGNFGSVPLLVLWLTPSKSLTKVHPQLS